MTAETCRLCRTNGRLTGEAFCTGCAAKLNRECDACCGHGTVESCSNGGNCPCDGDSYCRSYVDECEECRGTGVVQSEPHACVNCDDAPVFEERGLCPDCVLELGNPPFIVAEVP